MLEMARSACPRLQESTPGGLEDNGPRFGIGVRRFGLMVAKPELGVRRICCSIRLDKLRWRRPVRAKRTLAEDQGEHAKTLLLRWDLCGKPPELGRARYRGGMPVLRVPDVLTDLCALAHCRCLFGRTGPTGPMTESSGHRIEWVHPTDHLTKLDWRCNV